MKLRFSTRLATATALGLGALALLAAGAAATAGDANGKGTTRLWLEQDGDRLEVDDLGGLALGESRELTTESGKRATVTREKSGYSVDVEGKKIRIADLGSGALPPDGRIDRVERIELGEDGARSIVLGLGDGDLAAIAEPGAHAFFVGDGLPPLPGAEVDALVAGLEKSERFQGLDDTTQQLVRDIVREAAEKSPRHARRVVVRRLGGGEDAGVERH